MVLGSSLCIKAENVFTDNGLLKIVLGATKRIVIARKIILAMQVTLVSLMNLV